MQHKKLLLAGSHAGSTAIAVIEEIKKRSLDWEIHWIGKQFASEGKNQETLEYKNLSSLGVIFHNLESGKIQTKFTRYTIPALLKIPNGLIKSYKLVKEINPDLVLSFGSAAGALVSTWANYFKIPVFLHEQTATAGRANILSSYFASKILISRESSTKYFNKNKVELVGNPINAEILRFSSAMNEQATLMKRKDEENNSRVKTILITGGSRGSKWINDAVKPLLPRLLEKYFVIHQAGEGNLKEFDDIKNEKYLIFGQVTPKNMAEILSKADIVISRSGANTVSELIVLKKPTILIPIPWTYNDEATENAKYMEDLGLARILPQKELTPQRLLLEIERLITDYSLIVEKTKNIVSTDLLASEKIVDLLEESI